MPAGSHPHDVAPARDGGVWYTAQATGELGWLDPKHGRTRHIPLGDGLGAARRDRRPGRRAVDHRRRPERDRPRRSEDARGQGASRCPPRRLREPEHGGLRPRAAALVHRPERHLRRLDPATGAMRVWAAPGGSGPYGITVTPRGAVYYASLAAATSRGSTRAPARRRGSSRRRAARARAGSGRTRAGGSGSASGTPGKLGDVRPGHGALARVEAPGRERRRRTPSTSTTATSSGSPTSAATRSSASTRATRALHDLPPPHRGRERAPAPRPRPARSGARSPASTGSWWRGRAEADARTRTGDPIITSDVLYQLSYVGGAWSIDRPV